MKDTINLLGTILNEDPGRDAVHVAVMPVVAIEDLQPGQHIGPDGSPAPANVVVGVSSKAIIKTGIVDPFLKQTVRKGERFFMFMYPQTITSLRHEWTHPLFKDASREELSARIKELEDRVEELDCGC